MAQVAPGSTIVHGAVPVPVIRDVQAGMHSRGFSQQLLNNDEVRIQHYHDWMDHVMGVR